MKKKYLFTIISIMLCFSIIFCNSFFVGIKEAEAYAVFDAPNMVPNVGELLTNIGQYATQVLEYAYQLYKTYKEVLLNSTVTLAKILALLSVQYATAKMIGDDSGLVIRDWNQYLNVAPKQKAMDQMVNWYNLASQNRNSSMKYEGVNGNSLDSYFMWQAKKVIKGDPLATTITEYVPDPKRDLFSTGNMKGIMLYTQCGNNPTCFALTAANQYEEYVAQNKEEAELSQMNGFLPKKIDGRIFKPAALVSSALMQVDQVGTNLIMSAEANNASSYKQIAQGALIAITARAVNYGISDNEGKKSIANQAKSFPFSLDYSSKTRSVRVSK